MNYITLSINIGFILLLIIKGLYTCRILSNLVSPLLFSKGIILKLDTSYILLSFLAHLMSLGILLSCVKFQSGIIFRWTEFTQVIYIIVEVFGCLCYMKFCIKRMNLNYKVRALTLCIIYCFTWFFCIYPILNIDREGLFYCEFSTSSILVWVSGMYKFQISNYIQSYTLYILILLLCIMSIPYISIVMSSKNIVLNSVSRLYLLEYFSILISVFLRLTLDVSDINMTRCIRFIFYLLQSVVSILSMYSYKRNFIDNFEYLELIKCT